MRWIETGSRLHFGLIHVAPDDQPWHDRQGAAVLPPRRFAGAGLMLSSPCLRLGAEAAPTWSATGPLASRVLAFAQQFTAHTPCRLVVESALPEHVGLGSGTQLALAAALAVASVTGLDLPIAELARRTGRGLRSALGVHGFAQGGFLVEAGQSAGGALSPLVIRLEFPAAWRVLYLVPRLAPGLHGERERKAFVHLRTEPATRDALSRLLLLGMVPALLASDVRAFGEALFDYNARAGEVFAPVQGGVYADPSIAALIAFLRRQGVAGVGQSSWGPGVFAVVEDAERAAWLLARSREHDLAAVWVTAARNRGADLFQGTHSE